MFNLNQFLSGIGPGIGNGIENFWDQVMRGSLMRGGRGAPLIPGLERDPFYGAAQRWGVQNAFANSTSEGGPVGETKPSLGGPGYEQGPVQPPRFPMDRGYDKTQPDPGMPIQRDDTTGMRLFPRSGLTNMRFPSFNPYPTGIQKPGVFRI